MCDLLRAEVEVEMIVDTTTLRRPFLAGKPQAALYDLILRSVVPMDLHAIISKKVLKWLGKHDNAFVDLYLDHVFLASLINAPVVTTHVFQLWWQGIRTQSRFGKIAACPLRAQHADSLSLWHKGPVVRGLWTRSGGQVCTVGEQGVRRVLYFLWADAVVAVYENFKHKHRECEPDEHLALAVAQRSSMLNKFPKL